MGSLGWPEILLIAVVVVLLFGARKLPEIGRGLGEGIKSFRDAFRSGSDSSDAGRDKNDRDKPSSGGDKH